MGRYVLISHSTTQCCPWKCRWSSLNATQEKLLVMVECVEWGWLKEFPQLCFSKNTQYLHRRHIICHMVIFQTAQSQTVRPHIVHTLGLGLWDDQGVSAEHPAANRFYWLLTHHSTLSYFHCVISDRSRPSKNQFAGPQPVSVCVCMCVVWEVLGSQAAVCGCVPLLNKSAGFYTRCKMEELLWNTLGL